MVQVGRQVVLNKNIRLILLAFFVSCLGACAKDEEQAPPDAPAASAAPQTPIERREMPSPEDREALARQYAKFALTVVDVSEIELDGTKTLAITASVPLDGEQNFTDFIHLADAHTGARLDSAWELSSNAMVLHFRHLEPKRKLDLTIDAGLRSMTGKTLAAPYTTTLTTSDLKPMVGFASPGSLLPTRLAEGLPIITLNVDEVEVEFFRVRDDKMAQFASQFASSKRMTSYSGQAIENYTDLVYGGRFKLEAKQNVRETTLLPIRDLKPLQQPGVYYAVLRSRGQYSYALPATMFMLSDVGLSVHRYQNRLEVFAQSLDGGTALAGVELKLFDGNSGTLATATTDTQGRAELPQNNTAHLIVAKKGTHTSLLRINTSALDLGEFDISGAQVGPRQLFVFGPRDLYRPGETILLNALLRDDDGLPVPDQPIKVEIFQPDGEKKSSFSWRADANGFYQHQLKLSTNDPTGTWRVSFDLGDARRKASYEFRLEEFLPERMALELTASATPLAIDARPEFHVNGRYLYGAPASGNRLLGHLFVRPLREAVPTLPGFQFGSIREEIENSEIELPDAVLDSEGNTTVRPENEWARLHSPLQLVYQASLQESGGRPVTRRIRQAVWPAEQLPGVRLLFKNHAVSNGPAEFEIVMAGAQGQKLAAKGLKVRLIRERRDYFWSYYDGDWQNRYTEKTYSVAEDVVDVPADGTAKVTFPVEWGSYLIEVEDPQTHVLASERFWAGYSWQYGADSSDNSRPDQVKLTLDKAAYVASDVATVTVTPPAAGSGYLMVESSAGPLWWQPIEVGAEGKQFEIPVSQEWARHDLYLSALVVRPGERKTYNTPKRAVGVLHLPLDRQARKLALTLSAPEKMRPNQTLTVKVKADAADGALAANTRILVSAVDLGILNITSFQTPNPFDNFFARKRYEVDQFDVYGQVIETGQNRFAKLLFGGDADLAPGGKRPDSNVQLLALQSRVVTLNAQGEAEVNLDIPDFNGSVRIMAQAWNDGQFGAGEAVTVIAAPLVAELAAPRFLASGDETRLALDLTNLTEQNQTIDLQLSAADQVHIKGMPARQKLSLEAGKRQTLLIPVEASGGYGAGKLKLTIAGLHLPGEPPSKPIERSWQIGVRPPYPAEARYFRTVLAPGQSWRLPRDTTEHFDPRSLEIQVGLSSRPPLNLAEHIRQLIAYPYGCLEQITSGLYPAIYADPAALQTLGIKGDPDEKRIEKINQGIARLAAKQLGNGSFGLWNREGEEEYWLTVYATDFLLRAQERGFAVPDSVLSDASGRLALYLRNEQNISPGYTSDVRHLRFATRAYAALVLARNQNAPLGELRSLFEQRRAAKTALPLVQLSIALQLMGDSQRAGEALQEGLNFTPDARTRSADSYPWYGDYASPLRDEALLLAALEEYDLVPQQRPQRLLQLSDHVAAQSWYSTQERNALFLVGRLLLPRTEQDWSGRIAHAGQHVLLDNTHPQRRLDGAALQTLEVRNDSQEPLYLSTGLSGYPKKPVPLSNTLSITREYYRPDGELQDLTKLKSGDLVVAHLEIHATQYVPDTLVVDLLPAGLELENQNLGDSSASLQTTVGKFRDWKQLMENNSYRIKHQEFRDDRYVAAISLEEDGMIHLLYLARAVTPGQYIVPPPTTHAMYRPEWQSIGTTPGKLTVLPR
ncbi:lipoprotein [Betaproteobacteria bacterium]|nr:lipoprotein [Betaproteobacteria bacterium]GHT98656.1 lipoprotein [Betaproteobacteria bacterium]